MDEKKRTAAKVVTTLFPRIPKVTTLLHARPPPRASGHFCQEEVVLAAQDILEKLNAQVITYQDIRDTAENLIHLHNLCYKKAQDIAKSLGENIRKVIIIVGRAGDLTREGLRRAADGLDGRGRHQSWGKTVIDFDTNKVCIGHFSKRVFKGYFTKTALEFRDGECAGTVPYMAPEILQRKPYGRSLDWWSAGVTFYKLMTGRVPFRGETKDELKDKIINQPLKWPKAKDMVFKMLKKNPVERLGSATYADIRGHPFYADFNWKRLSTEKIFKTLKRKLLKMEEMVDIEASTQRPLYTYSSPSFKKMVNFAKKQQGPRRPEGIVFDTSGAESEQLDYRKASDGRRKSRISAFSGGGAPADKSITAKERMDVILFRTKSLGKYWSFGVDVVEVDGENNRKFFMVEKVRSNSPAEVSHVLAGDVIVAINGQDIASFPIAELVLTVLSSSAFRLLETRRDMEQIIKAAGRETIQLRAIRTACGGSGNYGFKTFEAKAWNESKKALVKCHVVQTVCNAQVITPGKNIFPGDVLLMIDGAPTVVHQAPRTVMTDENVAEPSAKAAIEPPKP
ncbi:hypothetical protein HPB48_014717 [Haemaphysalis longicornis]|uniref:Uncharacterized protein n=1 Tax=Haemaphysalis longicornis TaxID=44386 RepID=A0A9J6GVA6_HAELO|nr:hypothetical protein HPB48_014717 [Haemaphysalis longicornis]